MSSSSDIPGHRPRARYMGSRLPRLAGHPSTTRPSKSFENILLSSSTQVESLYPTAFLRLPAEPSVGDYVEAGLAHDLFGNAKLDISYFRRVVSNYADQPLGVLQGLRSARRYLERDLLTARDAFIAVQGELVDSGSATGAAQAVARHAPTIMLRPVIGASRAVSQTLMGVGNQVDRANVRKIEDVSFDLFIPVPVFPPSYLFFLFSHLPLVFSPFPISTFL